MILLSGRVVESDRVLGLRLGAGDCISKPFCGTELANSVVLVLPDDLCHSPSGRLTFGDLEIDARSRQMWMDQKIVNLLSFLANSPHQMFSREQLLDPVWGSPSTWQDSGAVTEHIRCIRRKLDVTGCPCPGIQTVRGIDYRFEP